MNKESMRRLQNIIESRFAIMHSRGDGSGAAWGATKTKKIWHPHICSLGMHLTKHRDNDGRLHFTDPATMMESFWGIVHAPNYIVVPEEVATKILALGYMP